MHTVITAALDSSVTIIMRRPHGCAWQINYHHAQASSQLCLTENKLSSCTPSSQLHLTAQLIHPYTTYTHIHPFTTYKYTYIPILGFVLIVCGESSFPLHAQDTTEKVVRKISRLCIATQKRTKGNLCIRAGWRADGRSPCVAVQSPDICVIAAWKCSVLTEAWMTGVAERQGVWDFLEKYICCDIPCMQQNMHFSWKHRNPRHPIIQAKAQVCAMITATN